MKVSKRKILIIDSDKEIQKYCRKILSKEYEIDYAETGKDGLDYINKQTYNLVLLELRLSDMEGFEILKEIKTKFPEYPVIMMSLYTTMYYQKTAEQLGASDYLIKEFSPERLITSIRKHIKDL